jgi:hypothetical protein
MTLPLILSITSFCLCISGFFFFRWYVAQKTAASRLLSDYREEVYRLIGEIDAATDRDSLLVEERIKTLRKLLDDTDRRISVYMRELQRSRNSEAVYTSLGRGIRAALNSQPGPQEQPLLSAEVPLPEITALPSDTQKETPAVKENPAEKHKNKKHGVQPRSSTSKPKDTKAATKTKIAQLAIKGYSPLEISSKLKLSPAEVELTLNLMNMSPKTPT